MKTKKNYIQATPLGQGFHLNGRTIICTIIILFCSCSMLFSQQLIHDLNKDSINQEDWIGKQGIWYFFNDSTDNIYRKITYQNDLKHGYFEEYDTIGKVIKQGFYKYGMLDSLYQEYSNDKEWIKVNFDYGIPMGVVSESGEMIYEIKCNNESKGVFVNATDLFIKDGDIMRVAEYMVNNIKCNDTNDNAVYSFSYYDEEKRAEYFTAWKGKRCSFCPRLDTINDFAGLVSIYYNMCLYKTSYNKMHFNRFWTCYIESFFINGKNTKSILYRSRTPYTIKRVEYYSKDNDVYKVEIYNRQGELKKTHIRQITQKNKTKWLKQKEKVKG